MTYVVLIMLAVALFSCAHVPKIEKSDRSEVIYTFTPKFDQNRKSFLEIRVTFRGDEDGKSRLYFPDYWAGQKALYKEVRNVELINSKSEIKKYESHAYNIIHRPDEVITVQYELLQTWDGPIRRKFYYRPIFQKEYFHFVGYTGLAIPDWDKSKKVKVTINWKGIPSGWNFASSFGVQNKIQVIDKENSLNNIRKAIYIAGDFKVSSFKIKGYPVYFLSRGKWKFSTDEFTDLLEKVIKGERDFWNDYNFPFFLVTMIPVDEEKGSMGGTGLTNTFSLFPSKEVDSVNRFRHLLTHEHFHTWNGRKIGRQEPEELIYWFSEGFTDYYTNLLNLRAQIITLDEYVDKVNDTIVKYFMSPARNSSNKRVVKEFWKNRFVEKLPYRRGFILAHNWNAKIKKETKMKYSVDNMMWDLFKEAQEKGTVVSANNIDRLIKPYLKDGVLPDIRKYIEKGETIIPHDRALGACYDLVYEDIPRFDIGFNYPESRKAGKVIEVQKNGPAYKAGLRNGQAIKGWSIYWGKVDQLAEIGILNKLTKKRDWVKYHPRGKALRIPQYKLRKGIDDKDECLQWFN